MAGNIAQLIGATLHIAATLFVINSAQIWRHSLGIYSMLLIRVGYKATKTKQTRNYASDEEKIFFLLFFFLMIQAYEVKLFLILNIVDLRQHLLRVV